MLYYDFWNDFADVKKKKGKLPQFCLLSRSQRLMVWLLPWSLLREMAKSFPSLSSGKPQLPGGRVAWSTSPGKTAGASGDELGLVTMTTAIRAQEPFLTILVFWVDSMLGQRAPELTSSVLTGKTLLTLTIIS